MIFFPFENRMLSIRVLAALLVAAAAISLSSSYFGDFVIALAYAHYLVALWSSRFHLKSALSSWAQTFALVSVLGIWSIFAITRVPGAFASFHLHHVLGETNPFNVANKSRESWIFRRINLPRFFFTFLAYLVIFREGEPYRHMWKHVPLWPFLLVVGITFFWLLKRINKELIGKEKWEQIGMDSLLLLPVIASIFYTLDVRWLVLYHISIWTFIPTLDLPSKKARNHIYLPMILISAALWTFTPTAQFSWALKDTETLWHFTYWGHLHHGVSYLLFFKSRFSKTAITNLSPARIN
jgi:hypothetical protein